MKKVNTTLSNIDDIILGCAIYDFSRQNFLKKVKTKPEGEDKPRFLTEEEIFETMVSLLAKGYLYFYEKDDRFLTIEPIADGEEPVPMPIFEELFSGKYEEMKTIQEDIDEYKERERKK